MAAVCVCVCCQRERSERERSGLEDPFDRRLCDADSLMWVIGEELYAGLCWQVEMKPHGGAEICCCYLCFCCWGGKNIENTLKLVNMGKYERIRLKVGVEACARSPSPVIRTVVPLLLFCIFYWRDLGLHCNNWYSCYMSGVLVLWLMGASTAPPPVSKDGRSSLTSNTHRCCTRCRCS